MNNSAQTQTVYSNHVNFTDICKQQIQRFNQNIYPSFDYFSFKRRTGRAVHPIQHTQDLTSYMALYGLQHYQRMQALLNHVQFDALFPHNTPVNTAIVDYGCGQGIGSISLIEYLISAGYEIERLDILLIEPSALSIKKAQEYITAISQKQPNIQLRITPLNCDFDSLSNHFLKFNTNHDNYIHLFSNVLDIYYLNYFNLKNLCEKIKQQKGLHTFLAVSPAYFSGQQGFDAFNDFIKPNNCTLFQAQTLPIRGFNFLNNRIYSQNSNVQMYCAHHQIG